MGIPGALAALVLSGVPIHQNARMGRSSKDMGWATADSRQPAGAIQRLPLQAAILSVAVGLSFCPPGKGAPAQPLGLEGRSAQALPKESGKDLAAPFPLADPVLIGSKGRYTAKFFVPVTQARAWAVLTNYEAMAGLMPDIKQAKVLNRHGSQLELAQTYQAPSTFGLPIKVVLAVEEKAPRWMRYRMLRGERILSLQGQWSLTRVRGGVLVDHQIALEPDLPAFLRPTYDDLNESNLRQSMVVLRRLMLAR